MISNGDFHPPLLRDKQLFERGGKAKATKERARRTRSTIARLAIKQTTSIKVG
jgi:transposase